MMDQQDQQDHPQIEAQAEEKSSEYDLIVALEGFEGPIDLMLNLARDQKLDLSTISILALSEQYLAYINEARKLKLELAADYLVMAAWLAYLKSRLLLPDPPEDEPNPAEMAEALKFQLLRLEAMQKASAALFELPQLNADTFLCGNPPEWEVVEKPRYYLPLFDLLASLGAPLRRKKAEVYSIKPMRLYSLEESVTRMRRLFGVALTPNWSMLAQYLPVLTSEEALEAKSALASTFVATLELVKAGELEVRQDGTFEPIFLRKREIPPTTENPEGNE